MRLEGNITINGKQYKKGGEIKTLGSGQRNRMKMKETPSFFS